MNEQTLPEQVEALYRRTNKAERTLELMVNVLRLERNRTKLKQGDEAAWADLDQLLDSGWLYSSRIYPQQPGRDPRWTLPIRCHCAGGSHICDASLKDMTSAEVVDLANKLHRSRERLYGCLMTLEGCPTLGPAILSHICEAGRNEMEVRKEVARRCLDLDDVDFPPDVLDDDQEPRDGR